MVRSRFGAATRSEGFTLLEILVALAILSVGLVAVFGSLQSGARQIGAAEATALRVLEARSIIDAALAAPARAAGEQTGAMRDGSPWRLVVEPVPAGAREGGRAYRLLLEVTGNGRTALALETIGVQP